VATRLFVGGHIGREATNKSFFPVKIRDFYSEYRAKLWAVFIDPLPDDKSKHKIASRRVSGFNCRRTEHNVCCCMNSRTFTYVNSNASARPTKVTSTNDISRCRETTRRRIT